MTGRPLLIAIVIAFAGALLAFTQTHVGGWNDVAKVATIESLAARGTWAIEDSAWRRHTGDVVRIHGHSYAATLPLLQLAGAAIWLPLKRVLPPFIPGIDWSRWQSPYFYLSLALSGIPALILILLFHRHCRSIGAPPLASAAATFLLAFASTIGPYAFVLNHHIPAATAVFASFHLIARNRRRLLFAAGLFASIAIACDLLAAPAAVAIGAWAILRHRRAVWPALIGGALPLLLTGYLDYRISGNVLPVFLQPGAYAYEGSAFAAVTGAPANPLQYAFDSLVGKRGLFQFAPVLLFGLAGLARAVRSPDDRVRAPAICAAAAFALVLLTVLTGTANFGGGAYAERYLLAGLPFALAFAVCASPLDDLERAPRVSLAILGVAALISVASNAQAITYPWKPIPPPLYSLLSR